MIVADTNLLVYLFIESDFTVGAQQVHSLDPDWVFPPIAISEASNVLVTLVREKHITSETASEALRRIEKHVMAGLREVSMKAVLELAIQRNISAYDAQFIVLADLLGIYLVTEDGKLKRTFPDKALSMEAFAGLSRGRTIQETRAPYRARRAQRRSHS